MNTLYYFFALLVCSFYYANSYGMSLDKLVNQENTSPNLPLFVCPDPQKEVNQSAKNPKKKVSPFVEHYQSWRPSNQKKQKNASCSIVRETKHGFRCIMCTATQKRRCGIIKHFKKMHAHLIATYFRFVCQCNDRFLSEIGLLNHIKLVQKPGPHGFVNDN